MESKTPYKSFIKNQKGFSIIEIMLVAVAVSSLIVALLLTVNPSYILAKGRDNRRISDLSMLDRVVSEYVAEKGVCPDAGNVLRESNVLPVGGTDLANAQKGWINQSLLNYTSKLPIDPLNTGIYIYKYICTDDTYELNASLEVLTDYSQQDGGNDESVYEVGNKFTLISP